MTDASLYPMIYKRKSFHLFHNIGENKISEEEINAIYQRFQELTPLFASIRTKIKIVLADETTCRRGEEYCILFYSEKKENYLQNIGYLGQQLDLYLVSKNIGTLWFGIGKVAESSIDELDFVIMIAITKIDDETKFRKDMFKSKRKPVEEIWAGDAIEGVTEIIRFAPSACNTQPWYVEHKDNVLAIYRNKKPEKRGIMPKAMVAYYNQIDIGIFICFLELCLKQEKMNYKKKHYLDTGSNDEKTLVAEYTLL